MFLCQGVGYFATVRYDKLLACAMKVKHKFELIFMSYQEISHSLGLWLREGAWPMPILLQTFSMSGCALSKVKGIVPVEIDS